MQEEFERHGIDWDGPLPEEATSGEAVVEVPETGCPLSPEQYQELLNSIDPLRESESFGIDIFIETVTFVNTHVVNASQLNIIKNPVELHIKLVCIVLVFWFA